MNPPDEGADTSSRRTEHDAEDVLRAFGDMLELSGKGSAELDRPAALAEARRLLTLGRDGRTQTPQPLLRSAATTRADQIGSVVVSRQPEREFSVGDEVTWHTADGRTGTGQISRMTVGRDRVVDVLGHEGGRIAFSLDRVHRREVSATLSPDEVLKLLEKASPRENVKVRDIGQRIVSRETPAGEQ